MKKQASVLHQFDTIAALMCQLEQPELYHPLIALIHYEQVKLPLTEAGNRFALGFYKISFKTEFQGQVKYGQGHYDFEEGGLAFLSPNQIVTMSPDEKNYDGYSLFFHPDLLRNYPLGHVIQKYGFFSYAVSEALFLSKDEKLIIYSLFKTIAKELNSDMDNFSVDVLVSQIELLLNYSNRFYHRQFTTRKSIHNDLTTRMNTYLSDRFKEQYYSANGLPSVKEIAAHLDVSPRYLTDMLKALTGQSARQHIQNYLVEIAKTKLSNTNLTVAEIAYELGFEHPQSFSKLFRQKTSLSPLSFRHSFDPMLDLSRLSIPS